MTPWSGIAPGPCSSAAERGESAAPVRTNCVPSSLMQPLIRRLSHSTSVSGCVLPVVRVDRMVRQPHGDLGAREPSRPLCHAHTSRISIAYETWPTCCAGAQEPAVASHLVHEAAERAVTHEGDPEQRAARGLGTGDRSRHTITSVMVADRPGIFHAEGPCASSGKTLSSRLSSARHGAAARRAAGLSRLLLGVSGMDDSLEDEHQQLVRASEDLERDHRELHDRPDDLEAHAAHRDKLRQHIADLHAHLQRLRDRDR